MNPNDLQPCGTFSCFIERHDPKSGVPERRRLDLPCGKNSCPICRRRKQNRLQRRLRHAVWPSKVWFWTVTTDPKVIDPPEAWRTFNRRWHVVHRDLVRFAPRLRYFRVIESTRSGLPHAHLIVDRFIPYHKFQEILTRHHFGVVLHYKELPIRQAIHYACKYITKELYSPYNLEYVPARRWSASQGLLAGVSYHTNRTQWQVVFIWRRNSPTAAHGFVTPKFSGTVQPKDP